MRFDWRRLRPMYWFQNEKTDWEWDEILNSILDNVTHIEIDSRGYTVSLDGVPVWVNNWPYSYRYFYKDSRKGLPSVKTRQRLKAIIDKGQKELFRKQISFLIETNKAKNLS